MKRSGWECLLMQILWGIGARMRCLQIEMLCGQGTVVQFNATDVLWCGNHNNSRRLHWVPPNANTRECPVLSEMQLQLWNCSRRWANMALMCLWQQCKSIAEHSKTTVVHSRWQKCTSVNHGQNISMSSCIIFGQASNQEPLLCMPSSQRISWQIVSQNCSMLKHSQLCNGKWWDGNVMQIKSQPNLCCTSAWECETTWHWHWSLTLMSICAPSRLFLRSFSCNGQTDFLSIRDKKFQKKAHNFVNGGLSCSPNNCLQLKCEETLFHPFGWELTLLLVMQLNSRILKP